MNIVRHDLLYYVNLLHKGIPFAFSRYGDGEWRAILGQVGGVNCDGHEYFPQLGEDLRRAVLAQRKAPYYYALGPKARTEVGQEVEAWLEQRCVEIVWHSTEVWLEASLAGRLTPLVQALRHRSLAYVGPRHLRGLAGDWFGCTDYIAIPERNCYLRRHLIRQSVRQCIAQGVEVVGFSAGMATNVLIDTLWQEYGDRCAFIDFGSVWDPYAGVMSRSYMRKGQYDFEALAAAHLRRETEYDPAT